MIFSNPTNRKSGTVSQNTEGQVSEQFVMLHREEHHDLYRSSCIVRTLTYRRLQCAGHVSRRGGGGHQEFMYGSLGTSM
jgi:hypothetical protein